MSSKATPSATPAGLRFFADVKEQPWAHDFFAAARRLEAGHDGPAFGKSASPAQDPIRFGQSARMDFSPRAIDELQTGDAVPRLRLLFSGLFGAHGPMPYHLTEFITIRRQHHNDTTVEAFADIFHHRFFSLLYRAWADTEPVIALDRPDRPKDDVFAKFMGAVGGTAHLSSRDFSDKSRRYYMGQIGPSSSRPESLERILTDHTGTHVSVNEFQGRWLEIEPTDCMRLGTSSLGDGSVLGSEVWSRTSAFEIEVGPLSESEYSEFLPGGEKVALVHEIVTAVVGLEMDWTVRLLRAGKTIDGVAVGDGSSGQGQLGWTSWMGDIDDTDIRDDLSIAGMRYASHKSGDSPLELKA